MTEELSEAGLVGRWVHSHEEDTGDRVVYRSPDFDFPPARGRDAFTLDLDGVALVGRPGPTDRGETTPGRWSLRGDTLTLEADSWSATFVVDSFDGTTLVLQRL
jgi:hypothetical protein